MRIGLFTDAYAPIISGVVVSVDTLRNELTKLGHEVFIVANEHEKVNDKDDHIIRIKGLNLPMKGLEDFRIGKITKAKMERIKNLKLDVIHCHTEFSMGRLGRAVARKYHIPVVHTYHTMYEEYVHYISKLFKGPLRVMSKWYSKSFANSADYVIFPSMKVKRTFEEYGFHGESSIIPTGIYLEEFRKINYKQGDLDDLRKSLGIDLDDFVMLFLGRLSREKSITELIKEFAKLYEQVPSLKLLLVGGGPDKDYFAKVAKDQGVEKAVIFTGMVPQKNVGKYYHISDLFVNFSISETQGLTYIEALASGVPLLVKYDENLVGVVKHHQNGLSFVKNNEFSELFMQLYKNKVLFNKITNNATKAIEEFSADQYGKNVLNVYQYVLEKRT
jgi:1,2-diacylglycerol 3-alpha-glucosyltransferase